MELNYQQEALDGQGLGMKPASALTYLALKNVETKNSNGDSSIASINKAMKKLESLRQAVDDMVEIRIEENGIDSFLGDYRLVEESIVNFSQEIEPILAKKKEISEQQSEYKDLRSKWKKNCKITRKRISEFSSQLSSIKDEHDLSSDDTRNLNSKKRMRAQRKCEHLEFKITEAYRLLNIAEKNKERMSDLVSQCSSELKTIGKINYDFSSLKLRMRHLIVMSNNKIQRVALSDEEIFNAQAILASSLKTIKLLEDEREVTA